MYFQADSLTTIFNILDELTGKDLSKKEEFFIITKTFLQQTKAQSQNKQILKDENSIYLENRNKLITLLKLNDGTKTEFIERYLPFDMTKAEKIDADAFSNMLHHQLSVLREMYKEPTPEYTHCVVESINLINTITLLLERNNKSIDKANQISKETNTLNNINRAFKSA